MRVECFAEAIKFTVVKGLVVIEIDFHSLVFIENCLKFIKNDLKKESNYKIFFTRFFYIN